MKQSEAKLRSLVHFTLPILFVLTLAFDKAVLYGNVAFSIVVLSAKNDTQVFQKRFSFFRKLVLKLK